MRADREQDVEVLRWVRELQRGVGVERNSRRIFTRYYGWVRGFFGRRGFAPEDAEDLTQETLLRVFHDLASFRGRDSSFDSWLFAVAANICRNERRRLGRDKRTAEVISLGSGDGQQGGEVLQIKGGEVSPERAAFEQQRRKALDRAIEKLPPQMRECLALRLGRDLKYREIATLLKIDVDTVKAHLYQARQRLRAELGEEFGQWKE